MTSAWNMVETAVALSLGSDRELMERFRRGDREAFTALYRAHSPGVFRFALHMTGDHTKATEITQDVFVWLIHHPSGFNPDRGNLGPFLAGVTRQFVRQRKRDERRWLSFENLVQRRVESPDPGRSIDAEVFRKAIAVLPLRYREPVVLCDLEGYSYAEAAALLKCAIGTIRSRLNRGHELLARKFQLRKNS